MKFLFCFPKSDIQNISCGFTNEVITANGATDLTGQRRYKGGGEEDVYYLKDHLGNIRTILKDEKNNPAFSNKIRAEQFSLLSARDYFPFGSTMRSSNFGVKADLDKWRYQGKERDQETGYDYFEARYYDKDLARFLQVDPKAERYRFFNPYMSMGNNPLKYLDPDGKEIVLTGTKADRKIIRSWLRNLQRSKTGNALYNKLHKSKTKHYLGFSRGLKPWDGAKHKVRIVKNKKNGKHQIKRSTISLNKKNLTKNKKNKSSAIIAHEFQHAADAQDDPKGYLEETTKEKKFEQTDEKEYHEKSFEERGFETERQVKNELDEADEKEEKEGKEDD